MTRGLQLSFANNILELMAKRTALIMEKNNLRNTDHEDDHTSGLYRQQLRQSLVEPRFNFCLHLLS